MEQILCIEDNFYPAGPATVTVGKIYDAEPDRGGYIITNDFGRENKWMAGFRFIPYDDEFKLRVEQQKSYKSRRILQGVLSKHNLLYTEHFITQNSSGRYVVFFIRTENNKHRSAKFHRIALEKGFGLVGR